MEQNKRKEYKFNIIDAALILIIIMAAAALIYVIAGNDIFSNNEDVTILYTIEIRMIKDEFLPSIREMAQTTGTKITDSVRSYDLGEVQQVKIDTVFTNSTNMIAGVIERKAYPDYSKISLTAKAKCKKEKGGYSVNGKSIMVGEQIDFRTKYLISYGYCVAIEELPEEG